MEEEEYKNERRTENDQTNNPLHGIKLVDILDHLVAEYGWFDLGKRIPIKWAREKVENLYLYSKKSN